MNTEADTALHEETPSTKQKILQAARVEFASNGLGGGRVDRIAKLSGANKRMLYHYFENKEGLYKAVIESIYAELRAHESSLNLDTYPPIQAIKILVEHTFWYFCKNLESIRLLNDENQHGASHVRDSERIQDLRSTLLKNISSVLDRGVAAGIFRQGIDPAHFYITVASVCYFPFSNGATLKAFLNIDNSNESELAMRLAYAKQAALGCVLLEAE